MSLTIIIPFLNEGEEVESTIRSIQDSIMGQCIIMLINDASTDGFDYASVANQYDCIYHEHKARIGVAASREEGVEKCTTKFFLLLDAHMRFYDKGWDLQLVEYLEKYPRAILCSQTRFLNKDRKGIVIDKTKIIPNAGYIDFLKSENFRVTWNNIDLEPMSNVVEIPCIIGAAYACNREYWQRIDGLNGLITYGTDEELLSIKVWMEGGRCLLIKNWVVGHIYRKSFPYVVLSRDIVYNRLFTAELLLPYHLKRKIFSKLHMANRANFIDAYALLKENYPTIRKQKLHLKSIFTRSIDDFIEQNDRIKLLNKTI